MATRSAGRDAHGLSRRTAQTGLLVAAFVVPQSFASSLTPRSWTGPGHRHRARHHAQLPAHRHHPGRRRGGRRRCRASPPVASSRSPRRPAASRRVPARPRDRPARRGRPAGAPPGRGRIRRPRTGAAGGVAHHHDRGRRGALRRRAVREPTPSTAGSAPGAGSPGSPWRCPPGSPSPRRSTTVQKKARADDPDHGRRVPTAPVQSLAASAGVIGFLTAFAATEHALAELAGTTLARALPGPQQWWRLTGHAAFLGALAIGGGTLLRPHRPWARSRGDELRAGARRVGAAPMIGPTVSGGPGSRIDWGTLGREGRRDSACARARAHGVPA